MNVPPQLRSRSFVNRWAWRLFWIGVLCPAPGFLYEGFWGTFAGLTAIGYAVEWSRALPSPIDGRDAFRAFVLAMGFFSNIVFWTARTLGDREVPRGWKLVLLGALATNVSLAVLFPPFLRIPGFWLWLAAWGALAWMHLEIPGDERVPVEGEEAGLPLVMKVWLGFVAFWIGVTVLNHVSPLPPEDAAPSPSALSSYVNDPAGLIPVAEVVRLDGVLAAFEKETSCQIAVATFPRAPAEPVEEFTLRTAERSRLGRKGLDNGAILFAFAGARLARLEVGYGLEGALPDVTAAHILREDLGPSFAKGEYAAGLDASVGAILTAVRGEYGPAKRPGLLRLAWRQVATFGKRLRREVWPFLRRTNAAARVGITFWASLLGVGVATGLTSFVRLARGLAAGARNLAHGKDTTLEGVDWQAMWDTVKVLAILAVLLGGTVYVVAGGGGFGGAGALVTW